MNQYNVEPPAVAAAFVGAERGAAPSPSRPARAPVTGGCGRPCAARTPFRLCYCMRWVSSFEMTCLSPSYACTIRPERAPSHSTWTRCSVAHPDCQQVAAPSHTKRALQVTTPPQQINSTHLQMQRANQRPVHAQWAARRGLCGVLGMLRPAQNTRFTKAWWGVIGLELMTGSRLQVSVKSNAVRPCKAKRYKAAWRRA